METFNIIGQQIDAVHNEGNDGGMDDNNEDRNGETTQKPRPSAPKSNPNDSSNGNARQMGGDDGRVGNNNEIETTDGYLGLKADKPHPNKGAFRFATQNIDKGYRTDLALQIMLQQHISMMGFQEWRGYSARDLTNDDTKRIRNQLSRYNMGAIITKHQIVIYDEPVFGNNFAEQPTVTDDGRLISIILQRDNNEYLAIMWVYGVAHGDEEQEYANGKTKEEVRISLVQNADDELKRIYNKYGPNTPIQVAGDLQDTLTRTDTDNVGSTRYKMMDNGILKWAIQRGRLKSFGFDHRTKGSKYITRRSRKEGGGGRGIDHFLVCDLAEKMSHSFYIDSLLCHCYIESDHDLLAWTTDLGYTHQTKSYVEEQRMQYKKISGIPMKLITNKNEDTAEVTYEYALKTDGASPEINQEREDLLETLQAAFGEENVEATNIVDTVTANLLELQALVVTDGVEQQTDGPNNILVKRDRKYREKLNEAMNEITRGLEMGMHKAKLIKTEREIITNKQRLKKLTEATDVNRPKPPHQALYAVGEKVSKALATVICARKKLTDVQEYQEKQSETKHEKEVRVATTQLPETELLQCRKALYHLSNEIDLKGDILDALRQAEDEIEDMRKRRDRLESEKGRKLDALSGKPSTKTNIYNKINPETLERIDASLTKAGCKDTIAAAFEKEELHQPTQEDDTFRWYEGAPEREDLEQEKTEEEWVQYFTSPNQHGQMLGDILTKAEAKLRKLKDKIYNRARTLKNSKLVDAALRNDTKTISKMLLAGPRDEPATHPVVMVMKEDGSGPELDEKGNIKWRPCRSVEDELEGTRQKHDHWTAASGGTRHSIFTKLVYSENDDAPASVKLCPDAELTGKDLETLLDPDKPVEPKALQEYINTFKEGYVNHMHEEPEPKKELSWPFYYNESGNFSDEEVEERFWKGLAAVPTKERHDTFTLNALARLPLKWAKAYLLLIKISLATRIVPTLMKWITRIPIPKPKPGETRPLALQGATGDR